MPTETKLHQLDQLADKIRVCQLCRLGACRTNAVPGTGNPDSGIVIIGEAPGRFEDESGEPFVGLAGKFLNKLLAHAGLQREDVFIINVIKCRPPENRKPEGDEIAACSDFLKAQIKALNPRLIVLLGSTAADAVLGIKRLSVEHGKLIQRDDRFYFVAYHPAARFHRKQLWEDFHQLGLALSQVDGLSLTKA